MFNKLKELARSKFAPIRLYKGDSVHLTYRDQNGETLLEKTFLAEEHAMTVDEGILFSGEYEGRRALGGAVLEKK